MRAFPLLRLLLCAGGAALLLAACTFAPTGFAPVPITSGAQPTPTIPSECFNSYFPVIQGATWTYMASGHLSGTLARTITGVSSDGFTDQHTVPGGMQELQWNCSDGISVSRPDMAPSGLIQAGDLAGDFQVTDTSGVTVPDNLGPGMGWNQESALDGTVPLGGQALPAHNDMITSCTTKGHEPVNVPAGNFMALRAECTTDQKLTVTLNGASIPTDVFSKSTLWYAPGVGIVKVEEVESNGTATTFQLVSYKIP